MKLILTLFGLTIVLLIATALYFLTGRYNIAATVPHWEVTHDIIEHIMERSVSFHSDGIQPPPLNNPELVRKGVPHFHGMCRLCHGAPGHPRTEFAEGLYPKPPKLTSEAIQKDWTDAELFWIVQHGIKLTGMPAFGPTHNDEELWGIVSFARMLPKLKPEDYNAMVDSAAPNSHNGEDHSHHPVQ